MQAFTITASALAVIGSAAVASAATQFDQNVTPGALWGSGNVNGFFTTDRVAAYDLELGLRGKLRHDANGQPANVFNSNGDGTYTFQAGVPFGQSYPTAAWSFEWSINTNYSGDEAGGALDSLTYTLGLDTDAGVATSFVSFDPIHDPHPSNTGGWWDHSMGNNSTGNGQGVEASDASTYTSYLATYNVAQNSWKANWYIPGFNPNATGTYDIYLAAFDDGVEVGRSTIQINVVPEPASLALLAVGGGVAALRRRRTA